MKKLIATALFFASFSVAMGAPLTGMALWRDILQKGEFKRVIAVPKVPTMPSKSVYDAIRQKDIWTAADIAVIDKCYHSPEAIAYCSSLQYCSIGWANGKRCMGVQKPNPDPNNPTPISPNLNNKCRPATCDTPPTPKPVPPPRPVPYNCRALQEKIDALQKRIDGIDSSSSNNNYWNPDALLKILQKQLDALLEEQKRNCPGNDKCVRSNIKCTGSGYDSKECLGLKETPVCINSGARSTCASKSCTPNSWD